jgi:uncharacterized protein YybS (DUF2232 family)
LDLLIALILWLAFTGMITGISSLTSAWALLKGSKPLGAVLAGALASALFLVVAFLILQSDEKVKGLALLQSLMDESWKTQSALYHAKGMTEEDIALLKNFSDKYVFWAFPAWVLLGSMIMGLVSYYLSSVIFMRVTPKIPRPMRFRDWVLPEPLVFGLVVGGLLKVAQGMLQLTPDQSTVVEVIANNLLVLFVGIYAMAGLCIISFFLHKWRLPSIVRFLGYFLLLLSAGFQIPCALGVLDVWFDFRKLKSPPLEQTS